MFTSNLGHTLKAFLKYEILENKLDTNVTAGTSGLK